MPPLLLEGLLEDSRHHWNVYHTYIQYDATPPVGSLPQKTRDVVIQSWVVLTHDSDDTSWVYHKNSGQAQNHQNDDKPDQAAPAFRDIGSRLARGGSTACEKKRNNRKNYIADYALMLNQKHGIVSVNAWCMMIVLPLLLCLVEYWDTTKAEEKPIVDLEAFETGGWIETGQSNSGKTGTDYGKTMPTGNRGGNSGTNSGGNSGNSGNSNSGDPSNKMVHPGNDMPTVKPSKPFGKHHKKNTGKNGKNGNRRGNGTGNSGNSNSGDPSNKAVVHPGNDMPTVKP
eukprot:scaffold19752_cov52-Attheya_sp.AAC.6